MSKLSRYCRICLNQNKETFSIYNKIKTEYLPNVVYNISGVKISPQLEPNAQICTLCAKAALLAQNIILRCQESEEFLRYENQQRVQKDAAAIIYDDAYSSDKEFKEEENYEDEVEGKERLNARDYEENIPQYITTEESISNVSTAGRPITENTTPLSEKPAQRNNCMRKNKDDKKECYLCEYCDYSTKIGKLLVAHKKDVHQIDDPNIFSCDLCPMRFSWKPTLYRHMQLEHNVVPEEKKFVCHKCGKAYLREIHLNDHIKQRHEPRRFKCAYPDCEHTFTRAFTLRRHFTAVHSTEARYHCSDCNKYFKIYDLWKYHNEVIHKNETIYCPQCAFPFRHKKKLEEHLQKGVCNRCVFACDYCQRRFISKTGLKHHLKNMHGID